MIQKQTILNVIDNSGAKFVCCIHVGNGFKQRYAKVGDIINVSVKSLRNKRRQNSKVLKGAVCKALVIRSRSNINSMFQSGSNTFLENSVVLLTSLNKLLFTRIFGGVPSIFRFSKYMRIISLSSGFHFS
nr:ribosomal protein L14 [Synura petersenii]UYM80154.1 ribosomal protein L14 [Synura petersenii]UYM80156.1 ribosomal protein L14 [Synura petersenii]UYM80158.1 ribosomal protein L14 [Synura petersenii]UYM80160.1 ribosomal protein L14 [Synura petersenii]